MFKTYLRLLEFARPFGRYAVPYVIFALFYAIFNTCSFALIIPILKAMFLDDFDFVAIYNWSDIDVSSLETRFNGTISYFYTAAFGEQFSVGNMLILLSVITITTAFLSNLFRYLSAYTVENLRVTTLRRMRNDLFEKVVSMNVGYFSDQRKGDIISKITSDVGVVQFCLTNTLQVAFRDPLLTIGYLIAMIAMSWELSIFSFLFLPLVAFIIGSIVKRLRHPAMRSQERMADMVSTLDESLSGIKVIKSYNATDYVKEKYFDLNGNLSSILLMMARRQQLASPMSEFLGITAVAIILIFGGSLVTSGSLGAAQFLGFIAIFSQITRPVRSFVDQFANINQGIAAGERILAVLDTPNEIEDAPNAVELNEFRDSIEFRDVEFAYEDSRAVIKGASFDVKRGQTVALVGPSGGGKSTLSELIPRFYDPQSGDILIDGVSIKDYTQHSLRDKMSVVAQETVLFNDTIEGNISMGCANATFEQIEQAAKVANAHQFIMETPEGYKTNIGDRGVKLSGGQRQRLSIARAVLKNPDILILDEATSALDTESEKLVQEALNSLLKGRTSIVIAHRLSTIYNADKIVVVDHGRIVEQGTHSELLENGGLYAKLIEMQSFE